MYKYLIMILIVIIMSSCVVTTKKMSKMSKDKAIVTHIMIKSDGMTEWMELTSPLINCARITGEYLEKENGDYEFIINKVYFHTNWSEGWSDSEYESTGKIFITKLENSYSCKIIEPIEIGEIIKGELRYYDDYYIGERGMTTLKNRYERIKAVNEYLKKLEGMPPVFREIIFNKNKETSYSNLVNKKLFPEFDPVSVLYKGDSVKKYKIDSSDDVSIADGLVWNTIYSKENMPDQLREVRNSGTMFRDYNEAIEWLYTDYNMSYYFDNVINTTILDTIVVKK